MKRILTLGFLLLFVSIHVLAQDEEEDSENTITTSKASLKGFHVGFFMGAYFANNYTAKVYDGYGVNLEGNINDFAHSYMNHKINIETDYNLTNGYPDYIGQSLTPPAASREDWHFRESDMPVEVKYYTGFMFGVQTNYGLSKRDAILFNMNFVNLSLTGTFTITTVKNPNQNQYTDTVHYFGLQGKEQRLMFQLGYQKVITNGDQLNLFVEGGGSFNYAHLQSNTIEIGGRTLDLLERWEQPGYIIYQPEKYVGWGGGAFGGVGVTLGVSSKYIMQLVYNASYETVDLGHLTTPKLQQSIGLRAYLNL